MVFLIYIVYIVILNSSYIVFLINLYSIQYSLYSNSKFLIILQSNINFHFHFALNFTKAHFTNTLRFFDNEKQPPNI